MNNKLIDKYIAIPLAISVLKNDREEFKSFKAANIYLDLVDSAVEKMTEEFHLLNKNMNKQRLSIKRIDSLSFNVNGEVVAYTPDQLRGLTRSVMQECLASLEIKKFNVGWDNQEGN